MSQPLLGDGQRARTADEPFRAAAVVTPNDSTNLTNAPARGLWIGVGGTIKVDLPGYDDGATVTVTTTVSDGSVFPFAVLRVWAAGTTASQILAGY